MKLSISSALAASRLQNSPPSLVDLSGTVHFIGIGGIGMSALAELFLARGLQVSGSDRESTPVTQRLAKLGAKVMVGHGSDNIKGATAVVVSTAIEAANAELTAARACDLPVWHRSDVLAALTLQSKLIAISGTHGKTTTTGMISQILIDADLDPTVVIGGIFNKIGSNARAGSGEFFVAEIDESDGTQVRANPYISVITNIEADHLENYPGGVKEIQQRMSDFANASKAFAVLCADDPGCKRLANTVKSKLITYGNCDISPHALYTYKNTSDFAMVVFKDDKELGQLKLSVPGEHNKLNALAAAAVALELGVGFDKVKHALQNFNGVARRFEIIGDIADILIVDDYAHHPTEVKATLEAACTFAKNQGRKGRLVAIFQPHQPRRLRDLWEEFSKCFKGADLLIMVDVYIARGSPIPGITSKEFTAQVDHPDAIYIEGPVEDLAAKVLPHLRSGDLVLTIGAGNVTQLGRDLLKLLQLKSASAGKHGRT